jgi:DNA-binding transcriptional ArsR family regulator
MAEVEEALSKEQAKERALILRALKEEGFVPKAAAEALGMSHSTVRRRIEAYGLDDLVQAHNRRLRRRRENAEFPRAPHEKSRQAMDQQEHRESGMCSCGRPPVPKRDGEPGRMCGRCRDEARRRKQEAAMAKRSPKK